MCAETRTVTWLPYVIGAYVVGSIPFGVLMAAARGVDIRAHGSGNIGATNVGRVLGRSFGLACFVLDAAKGAVPVLIAGGAHGVLGVPAIEIAPHDSWWWLAVACAALGGHMASIFLRFRGGKGVATAFGGLLAMWPTLGLPALLALAVWIVVMALSRIVSLASMVAAVVLPAATILLLLSESAPPALAPEEVAARRLPAIVVASLIGALVLWRHRANIRRLIAGTESRVGRS